MIERLIHNDYLEIDVSGSPPVGGWDPRRVGGDPTAAPRAPSYTPITIRVLAGNGSLTVTMPGGSRTLTLNVGDLEQLAFSRITAKSGITLIRVGFA